MTFRTPAVRKPHKQSVQWVGLHMPDGTTKWVSAWIHGCLALHRKGDLWMVTHRETGRLILQAGACEDVPPSFLVDQVKDNLEPLFRGMPAPHTTFWDQWWSQVEPVINDLQDFLSAADK